MPDDGTGPDLTIKPIQIYTNVCKIVLWILCFSCMWRFVALAKCCSTIVLSCLPLFIHEHLHCLFSLSFDKHLHDFLLFPRNSNWKSALISSRIKTTHNVSIYNVFVNSSGPEKSFALPSHFHLQKYKESVVQTDGNDSLNRNLTLVGHKLVCLLLGCNIFNVFNLCTRNRNLRKNY
jgi:hypothetical protein